MTARPAPACGQCGWFADAPAGIERGLPGLTALGSAHASSRAGDGLCARHDRYVPAAASCRWFAPAAEAPSG